MHGCAHPIEELASEDIDPPVKHHADDTKCRAHERGHPEEGRCGVVHAHVMVAKEELGECPSQTSERGRSEDEDEPAKNKMGLGGDHQKDTGGNQGDNANEAEGEALKAEEKGEEEDEDERRRFDHCWKDGLAG